MNRLTASLRCQIGNFIGWYDYYRKSLGGSRGRIDSAVLAAKWVMRTRAK